MTDPTPGGGWVHRVVGPEEVRVEYALGIGQVAFAVDDIDAADAGVQTRGGV